MLMKCPALVSESDIASVLVIAQKVLVGVEAGGEMGAIRVSDQFFFVIGVAGGKIGVVVVVPLVFQGIHLLEHSLSTIEVRHSSLTVGIVATVFELKSMYSMVFFDIVIIIYI